MRLKEKLKFKKVKVVIKDNKYMDWGILINSFKYISQGNEV